MMKPILKLVLISFLSALLLAVQLSLAVLPNIEAVTLLILIYSITLPLTMVFPIVFIFVLLQVFSWGLGDWVLGYFWIWPLWALIVRVFKPLNQINASRWALLSGFWGLLFGFLFAFHHGVLYGFNFMLIYWIRGISFDIVHMISNYILVLLLFNPIYNLIEKLIEKSRGRYYESNHKNR